MASRSVPINLNIKDLDVVKAAIARAAKLGRAAGYAEAVQRLRDLSPEFVALAIRDVSYGGTQVAAWHARHLGKAALDAITLTVEASAPARATTEETPR